LRLLPVGFVFWLGRRLGDLVHFFDARHRTLVYANLKTAFGGTLSLAALRRITHAFYHSFGQNIMEIFLIPRIDRRYVDRYITIEGKENIEAAFHNGKGVIFVSVHAGSWELSNILSANLGVPFWMFVREQKLPRLNRVLNEYRRQRGCRLLQKENQLREVIRVLKSNEAIGMTLDQGGRDGLPVDFMGRSASMAYGAVRLALKYGAAVVPVFSTRLRGPRIKMIIQPPVVLQRSGDEEKAVRDNLQSLVRIFEEYIRRYPQEYLWSYRIWKYSVWREVLIVSDGKTGHLRQSQALAQLVSRHYQARQIQTRMRTVEVRFRAPLVKMLQACSSLFSNRLTCPGCLQCLRRAVDPATFQQLCGVRPDIIISCGSSVAPVNALLARENQAKSLAILKPAFLDFKKFDLVVMPEHDHPARRKNVVVTQGALNLITPEYLREQSDQLSPLLAAPPGQDACIGVLLGGDTKQFRLPPQTVRTVLEQVRQSAEALNVSLLVTTSRRTSAPVEAVAREVLGREERCKLLVIANERNIPAAVGGILGMSRITVVSPESISMISEAASSKNHVIVFTAPGLSARHQTFLQSCAEKKYIYLAEPDEVSGVIAMIRARQPQTVALPDAQRVSQALESVL